MRFTFKLYSRRPNPVISFNFQHSFSVGISQLLAGTSDRYDEQIALQSGQKPGLLKDFKDFSFSEIHCQFVSKEGRMCIAGDDIRITVCFQLPQIASKFISETFLNRRLEIGDEQWNAVFTIGEIHPFRYFLRDGIQEIKVITASPLVAIAKKTNGEVSYIGPAQTGFADILLNDWREKYKRIYGSSQSLLDFLPSEIKPVMNPEVSVKTRTVNLSINDRKIPAKGYMNFYLQLTGTRAALELILNTGVGMYNHLGMGCITVITDQRQKTRQQQQRNQPRSRKVVPKIENIDDEISMIFKKFSK